MLRRSEPNSVLSKLIQSYIVITPHGVGPERAIKYHNDIKSYKRSNTSRETMNCRLFVSLNRVGTAHFDLREAVQNS